MIKVGLVGFGGIARVHKAAYETLMKEANSKVKLVSIFDVNASQFTKSISINFARDIQNDISAYHLYDDLDEMLAKEELHMLDVCIPTFLHEKTVCDLLNRGYHVYCEKPMAATFEEAMRLIEAKRDNDKRLLIGHLLRFMEINAYMNDILDKNIYGNVVDAAFYRLSAAPRWNGWLLDADKSGGCILDMHMHDIDLARFFFGDPYAVSTLSKDVYTRYDTNHTTLYYDDFTAQATGDWALSASFPFTSGYRISLDKATIVLDGNTLTVYPEEGEAFSPDCTENDGILNAIRYFVRILETGEDNTVNPSISSAQTVYIIKKMKESADRGGKKLSVLNLPR